MHKLLEYICDELEDLERKAEKDGKLSMTEVQYMDTLAHAKKNLLKSEEMMEEGEYSGDMGRSYRDNGSYRYAPKRMSYARGRGRNARRDAMGRYSRSGDDFRMELHEIMQEAPNDQVRMDIQNILNRMDAM